MARAWVRYVTRISLALLLIIAVVVAALSVVAGGKLEIALLYAGAVAEPLLANSHPPAIADGLFTSWDWRLWGDDDRKFTAILEQKFPIGTNEAQLKSTLLGQGFKATPPRDCLPPGQPAPIGKAIHRCPSHDQSKELRYKWSRLHCGQFVTIWWKANDNGEITQINGIHFGGCL
jgi:hypothetical protein